jgi:hypothetical protein
MAECDSKEAEFFSLDAEYQIKPGASLFALAQDARCLLGAGLACAEEKLGEGPDEAVWAAIYTMRQAKAVLSHLVSEMEMQGEKTVREVSHG